ncbi:uncharacterized protein LOC141691745 [Apium graveolens]|uniref:uncharacterized protein LOC141691745 n=1 Tax=Apium graveolens TaxID=4045 RepID=UPI003D7AE884
MNAERSWMYQRTDNQGYLTPTFTAGLEKFMEYVKAQPSSMGGTSIKCPCFNCANRKFWDADTVELHLLRKGFVKNYYVWDRHGEPYVVRENAGESSNNHFNVSGENINPMYNMVMDAACPNSDLPHSEERPNSEAQKIYNMLQSSERELYDGCETSQLSAIARMLSLKSEHNWSEACYNQTSQFFKEILPKDNSFLESFYSTKKYMEELGLPSIHIDCCVNGCMLFWGEDKDMELCKFCSQLRYKVRVNRLQRLYASPATATNMRWHAEHYQEDNVMRHCSDSEEWKQFNREHPSFSSEIRNVRLGLSADGFQPFGQTGSQYSSWPIITTPYNLPPWMCSKEPYMFLSILVPETKNPKQKIDVFLQPLIAELNMLWNIGVEIWDVSLKQNFQMRAALMWTISDFPAYSMLSGWKTVGHLACPHCAHDHDSYNISYDGKPTWFDNHRKFLPPDHWFRKNKNWFTKGKIVNELAPPVRRGEYVFQEIESLGLMNITELESDEHNVIVIKTYNCGWKQ